ncbi:histidine kinase [Ruminococcaceae bacterium OttesenSCG-928-A11]|nr:histidine kinase [Ruminococcaceae bacterium OttesenSCG-928-A11]
MDFEAYLGYLPQPVVILDRLGQVLAANAAFLGLFPRVEAAENLRAFSGDYPMLERLLNMEEGQAQLEVAGRHYLVQLSAVRHGKGRYPAARCILMEDVTERARLAAETRRQSELLEASNDQVRRQNELLDKRIRMDEEAAALREQALLLRDLHDTLGHTLTVLGAHHALAMGALPDLERARTELREALRLTEISIAGLESMGDYRPGQFTVFLQRFQASMRRVGLEVVLDIGGEETQAHRYMYTDLMRICQEAATNSLRHGAATRLQVWCRMGPRQVSLRLRDNGRGGGPVYPGNGLSGMDERVNNLFGDLCYGYAADGGFEVAVEAPVIEEEPGEF